MLKAEDIIALKLQSVNNNPDRLAKNNSDIEELMKNRPLNWEILKSYFELFNMGHARRPFTPITGKHFKL